MARKRARAGQKQLGVITLQTLLLLFTGGLLVLILLLGFAASYGTFRDYVADQLEGHARDGATATGLSLSNAIDGRDPVAAASLIDAVFDSGRYLSVQYLAHDGTEIAGRQAELNGLTAPGWFVDLASLPLPVAEAEVVRGWTRLGTVRVVSHPGRAYNDLWRITLVLLAGVAIIGGLALFILHALLGRLLKPLKLLEQQARAWGQKDFRKRVHMRSTRELNQVTEAMNQMAEDLGRLFEGQAKLIHHLRKVNNEDAVTGLYSRGAFDQRLKVEVESEEKSAPGVLVMIQLGYFTEYNRAYGRVEGDQLLRALASRISAFVDRHAESFAGRRTGAEFALFLPGASVADARVWANDLLQELDGVYAELAAPMDTVVHAGLAAARPGEHVRDLLSAVDEALRAAQQRDESCCWLAEDNVEHHHSMDTWRTILTEAIRKKALSLWLQPMVHGADQQLVHYQVFSRLKNGDGDLKAGVFVPMAERLGLLVDIDRLLMDQVIKRLKSDPTIVMAVSLGLSSVAHAGFRTQLLAQLAEAGDATRRLWIGISELAIHHHRRDASVLVRGLARLRVPVLVDRFGVGGVPFSYLRNLPFSGLRIDNSFVHDLDSHEENRFWLESVVGIASSRGVKVFATGVETAAEYSVLCALGVDGAMGYHLGRPFAAEQQPTRE